MDKLPILSVDLIDWLDEQYPERCPDPKQSDREIWIYAGARQVVRSLLAKKKQEEEENYQGGIHA